MKTIIITIAIGFIMLLYGFTIYKPMEAQNVKSEDSGTAITGAALFQKNCAVCHGADLSGNPPAFPSLKEVKTRMTRTQIADLLKTGRNNMPSFSFLNQQEKSSIYFWLKTLEKDAPRYNGMIRRRGNMGCGGYQ